jgi:hypothetical protein
MAADIEAAEQEKRELNAVVERLAALLTRSFGTPAAFAEIARNCADGRGTRAPSSCGAVVA